MAMRLEVHSYRRVELTNLRLDFFAGIYRVLTSSKVLWAGSSVFNVVSFPSAWK